MLDSRFDVLARGRRSLALDLRAPGASDLLLELVGAADGLIEGFRPGVMERMGLAPEECLRRQPRLVYGRMTGWGQQGPLARQAGHDLNYLGLTGALHAIGPADRPPSVPLNYVADFGGGMLLAFGMLAALLAVRGGAPGQVVDAAMVDGAGLLAAMFWGFRAGGAGPTGARATCWTAAPISTPPMPASTGAFWPWPASNGAFMTCWSNGWAWTRPCIPTIAILPNGRPCARGWRRCSPPGRATIGRRCSRTATPA